MTSFITNEKFFKMLIRGSVVLIAVNPLNQLTEYLSRSTPGVKTQGMVTSEWRGTVCVFIALIALFGIG